MGADLIFGYMLLGQLILIAVACYTMRDWNDISIVIGPMVVDMRLYWV